MCARHAQATEDQADAHYRSVIRAFVSEAIEVSQVLEKVTNERRQTNLRNFSTVAGSRHCATSSQHLATIEYDDWVRI